MSRHCPKCSQTKNYRCFTANRVNCKKCNSVKMNSRGVWQPPPQPDAFSRWIRGTYAA
jgi:uncharacterized protein (DUF983 family)